ncbi:MAG: heavy metal translocating P-type ATPase [gamma proteobacterium symbiont of Taylorina sp.]|nr:heavy metal translocating P-type ATPase [gamma proteobacterium symbiont of Taylorina sp.]
MIEALFLIGGNLLGISLYYKNKKKSKKQHLHALMGSGPRPLAVSVDDTGQVNTITEIDQKKEKTKEEIAAMRVLNSNVGSVVLLVASRAYPILTLPGMALAVYGCIPIYKRTYISVIKERKLKNDLLNGLVVTGTLATGHFLVTALFTFVSNLGTVVVQKSKGYSEEMLKGVFDQKVSTVWLLRDGSEIETPIEEVKINDVVIVHTGELIPLDGIIVKGAVTVDQHALTGESIPVEKAEGDKVLASTVVIAGYARIEVTQTGENTVVAKIENVLQGTSHFKTGLQLKGESWADKAAAPILGLGVLLWPFQGAAVTTAVFNMSPGNGIRLSASAQTLTHIILAAQENILIKDGRVLEQLMEVDTVIFDKTGTLTEDEHAVSRILCANNDYSEDDILYFAAATEQKVSHPLARAIIEKAEALELTLPDVALSDSRYEVGMGVTATVNGKTTQVGSLPFMEKAGIPIPDEIKDDVQATIADGFSVVMVVVESQIVGAIEIQAQLRPEVKQIIKSLRGHGIKHMYILSGDQLEPTRQMAEMLELDGYFHNVSPEDKSNIIERLQGEGKKVCFIGDGINDVIAMKKANASISLSGASTIATDVAQVILMNGTLHELDDLFEIAHRLKSKLIMTITSYTTVVLVSFTSIMFLGAPPFVALVVQSLVNNTYGMSQALLPLKQLRDKKKKEYENERKLLAKTTSLEL